MTYNEIDYTNSVDLPDNYRVPIPCGNRLYEVTGVKIGSNRRFEFQTVHEETTGAQEFPFEVNVPQDDASEKRLVKASRSLFWKDDLTGPLPYQQIQALALPFESYRMVFTPGLLSKTFENKVSDPMLHDAGYIHFDDVNWWAPSGKIFYSSVHFFLPQQFVDPFANTTSITYDRYSLLLKEIHDPVDNIVTTVTKDEQGEDITAIDYRVLQPWTVIDPNGNRVVLAFDVLGSVAFTAVMGKLQEPDGIPKGDILPKDLDLNLSVDEMSSFFDNPDSLALDLLGTATTRFIYDVDSFYRSKDPVKPGYAAIITRDTHVNDLNHDDNDGSILPTPIIQVAFSYSDGLGREIQKKIPAEPEKDSLVPRWVGSGWTVFNNKGKPVKKYEPFFAEEETKHKFEFGKEVGVSPTLFYDPVDRSVATLHPNHTYEKVVFSPWEQKTFDVNDTVMSDPEDR